MQNADFKINDNGLEGALSWYRKYYANRGYIKREINMKVVYETTYRPPYKRFKTREEVINEIVQRKLESLYKFCYENNLNIEDSKSYDAILVFPSGDLVSIPRCRLLKQSKCPSGYYWVKTSGKHAEQSHRVIAKCFIPNPNDYPVINHIDGNKTNNNISNLEWCTRSQNVLHSFRNGLEVSLKGEKHPMHKLTEDNVRYVREHYIKRDKQYGAVPLANKFHVDRTTIMDIINNKLWRNVQ